MQVCYTVDAGANVHVLCLQKEVLSLTKRLREIRGVEEVLVANVGGPAKIVEKDT